MYYVFSIALRQFGLEGRLEYTPNNESIVPSTFYHSLSYTMNSLRDVVFQVRLFMNFSSTIEYNKIYRAFYLKYLIAKLIEKKLEVHVML